MRGLRPGSAALLLLLAHLGCHAEEPESSHSDHDQAPPAEEPRGASPREDRLPSDYAAVELGSERAQKFGIRTEPATRQSLTHEVRTVGVVRTDETRESHVHVKWQGWIQEFFVSFVGQDVKRGDPLFSVYSPDLVTAQQELLVARARAIAARALDRPDERASAETLLQTARTKLRLFDVSDDEIARIEEAGDVLRALVVRAPRGGTVIDKMAVPGMYVDPAMDLYTIADLSRVWVLADLYEYEIPQVRLGQAAKFSLIGADTAQPAIETTIAFIHPTVERQTRTVKVRLDLANDRGTLRPGAYGIVRLEIPLEPALAVPSDAVLDTGLRQIVFVRIADGIFEPRTVRLGTRAGDRVQVLEGLAEGEEVVTRGQFLLDSESRLRAAGRGPGHGAHS